MKNIILQNYYKLNLDSLKQSVEHLKDSDAKKSLIVTLEISRSGKITNGRIYPPKGHQAGLDSWTKPYEKPFQLYLQAEGLF